MTPTIQGGQDATGMRFGIVVSRFNHFVTDQLLSDCVTTLSTRGAADQDITVVQVPGAFEIPVIAQQLARSNKYDVVICLGAVIRGHTPHFDYICAGVAHGIAQVALETGVPVIFGVLTTDTQEQAMERVGGKIGNRGVEAAMAAIEMVGVRRKF